MTGSGAVRVGEDAARGLIAKAARSALRDADTAVGRELASQGEKKTAKELLDGSERSLVAGLSDGDRSAVAAFKHEADQAAGSITPKMERIEASIPGAELAGKEFAKKSESSLSRKVATDLLAHPGRTVDQALAGIKDSVRYTFRASRDDYSRVTQDAVGKLKDAGFEPYGAPKNFWSNEAGYQGINSFWRDSETGKVIEVQFHSLESHQAKEATHAIYDFQRLPTLSDGLREQLTGLQNRVFQHVGTPPGAPDIGWSP